MNSKDAKILIVHPEANMYRREFFNLLQENLNVTFAFTGGHNWVKKISESKSWKFKNFRPYKIIGYQGEFTPSIIKELIKDYDIIISSIITSFPTHIAFIISKLTNKKFITFDEIWVWPRNLRAFISFPYIRYIAKKADLNLVSGTKARDFFINTFKVPENKIVICRNSSEDLSRVVIDKKKLACIKEKINPYNKKIVLYLSRVIKLRNLDCLLRAFSFLEQKYSNILLVIGGVGEYLNFCNNLCKQLKIINVKFIGHVEHDDTPYYYKMCDIFVLPGKFLPKEMINAESWGLVLNEAMSLGKPVISTDSVGGAFDLISSGRNGYRIKNNNVTDMINALEPLILSDKLRKEMGTESLNIIKKFTAQEQLYSFVKAIQML